MSACRASESQNFGVPSPHPAATTTTATPTASAAARRARRIGSGAGRRSGLAQAGDGGGEPVRVTEHGVVGH